MKGHHGTPGRRRRGGGLPSTGERFGNQPVSEAGVIIVIDDCRNGM